MGDKKAIRCHGETKRHEGDKKAIRETKRPREDKKAIRETKRPLGRAMRQKGHGETKRP